MSRWLELIRLLLGRHRPSFAEVQQTERDFYLGAIRDGMTVFDVGANIGELTLLFARLAEAGVVHAFEANPQTFARLKSSLATSGHSNVIANSLAVAEAPGTVTLHCYEPPFDAFSTAAARDLAGEGVTSAHVRTESVAATSIDAYCREQDIARIDLLKIDVEGAEYQVLCGAEDMLADKRIDCILFEYGQATYDKGNGAAAIRALLSRHGYRITPLGQGAAFPRRDDPAHASFAMYVARP